MQVINVLHAARWKYRTQKSPKLPSRHHRTILSGYIFAAKACIDNRKKNLSNSNIYSTCPHIIANFSPLAAEVGSGVWSTPANFKGFRVLASLLQRRCSPEANQTLHDFWSSPGLVDCIYIFGSSCLLTEFLHMQNSLCVQVLRSPILAALLHGTPAAGVSQTLRRGTRNWITERLHAEGATCIRLGGHDVGHRPTFKFCLR